MIHRLISRGKIEKGKMWSFHSFPYPLNSSHGVENPQSEELFLKLKINFTKLSLTIVRLSFVKLIFKRQQPYSII